MNAALLGVAVVAVAIVGACYYTPKPSVSRPPAVTVANTPAAQACSRMCLQTHQICHNGCSRTYTQYNGREMEQATQQCVTGCDDSRDVCLRTC